MNRVSYKLLVSFSLLLSCCSFPGQAKAHSSGIFWSWSTRVAWRVFHVSSCLQSTSQTKSLTSSSNLSTPSRATRGVFTSKPFLVRSRVDKVRRERPFGRTMAHKLYHSSGLEHAKWKIETSGSAPIVVQLEQTLYMVSYRFNYAKTDAKNFQALMVQCFVWR